MAIAIRQTSSQEAKPDGYLDSLTKLVPGDVLLGYTAILKFSGMGDDQLSHWLLLGVFTVLTPVILWLSSQKAGVKAPPAQYFIRTLAFVMLVLLTDAVLVQNLTTLAWTPHAGAMVIVLLSAYIVKPTTK